MPRVYLETTIPSYLTARPSGNIVRAAEQEVTRGWWARRAQYELYVSQYVLDEIASGDPEAAAERIAAVERVPILATSAEAVALAEALLANAALPANAAVDALHIAVAAVHGMDLLLTWNCRHIANATMRPRIERSCRAAGYEPPVICTPLELGPE